MRLPAAICYAGIAPAVPHALHMPSHIFTRVGQWQNSILSNRASAEAGQKYAANVFGPGVVWDQSLHAMDYLEYAYLQTGQDTEAKRVLDQLAPPPLTPLPRVLPEGDNPASGQAQMSPRGIGNIAVVPLRIAQIQTIQCSLHFGALNQRCLA
jgi:hypothetical protein